MKQPPSERSLEIYSASAIAINVIICLSQPYHLWIVANLIVRNVDDAIANALKVQASKHGISAEAEHRRILEQALLRPKKRSFIEALSQIPDVGTDADFARIQDRYLDGEANETIANPLD
jgi:antitoxin FitA